MCRRRFQGFALTHHARHKAHERGIDLTWIELALERGNSRQRKHNGEMQKHFLLVLEHGEQIDPETGQAIRRTLHVVTTTTGRIATVYIKGIEGPLQAGLWKPATTRQEG